MHFYQGMNKDIVFFCVFYRLSVRLYTIHAILAIHFRLGENHLISTYIKYTAP